MGNGVLSTSPASAVVSWDSGGTLSWLPTKCCVVMVAVVVVVVVMMMVYVCTHAHVLALPILQSTLGICDYHPIL